MDHCGGACQGASRAAGFSGKGSPGDEDRSAVEQRPCDGCSKGSQQSNCQASECCQEPAEDEKKISEDCTQHDGESLDISIWKVAELHHQETDDEQRCANENICRFGDVV
jgi:hypothetical protein